jgi:hypothetical protein
VDWLDLYRQDMPPTRKLIAAPPLRLTRHGSLLPPILMRTLQAKVRQWQGKDRHLWHQVRVGE